MNNALHGLCGDPPKLYTGRRGSIGRQEYRGTSEFVGDSVRASAQEFVPRRRDATVTTRMKKAGGIILAKTTMGESAAGNIGSAFGIARNAYDLARSAAASFGTP